MNNAKDTRSLLDLIAPKGKSVTSGRPELRFSSGLRAGMAPVETCKGTANPEAGTSCDGD